MVAQTLPCVYDGNSNSGRYGGLRLILPAAISFQFRSCTCAMEMQCNYELLTDFSMQVVIQDDNNVNACPVLDLESLAVLPLPNVSILTFRSRLRYELELPIRM